MARYLCESLYGIDDDMGHALGMDNQKSYKHRGQEFYQPYRNYFTTGIDGDQNWDKAVEDGLAEKHVSHVGQCMVYRVTRAGMDYIGRKLGVYVFDEKK